MKKLSLLIFVLLFKFYSAQVNTCQHNKLAAASPSLYYSIENTRSDTFNIFKYTIDVELGTTSNKFIAGNTTIKFAPKLNNTNYIRFDLLKLIVDSIKEGNTTLTYTYNDTILKVNFASVKNLNDTSNIKIYYHGLPQTDASTFGGFYFNNTQSAEYAYNIGVGFNAKPHNYGRVWFPCFDNFIERSLFDFKITSDSARRAFCNGELVSDVTFTNKRTRRWFLNKEIPTYLACVALAKYNQVNWSVNTLSGIKPITLVAVGSDTSAMKTGFVNLPNCIAGFENFFGPYVWNKIGYYSVPFNAGAMEHATAIAYPKAALGNLGYESDLMAHELGHHWWGDLITCETQEDMWINEGMATYASYLFLEWKYGKNSYLNAYKSTHDDLIHILHKKENYFRAVSGVPHNLTYGDHVYKKGADIAHTLRSYMGDTAFFNACKYVMTNNAYKNINSLELRDQFQISSGQNLIPFFNNWVLNGGWSHFSIDSTKYILNGSNYDATVYVKQKLLGAPALHTSVPLEISFFKSDWTRVVKKVIVNGASTTFTTSLNFLPIFTIINFDSKIGDATTTEYKTIKNTGSNSFSLAKVTLSITNVGIDSNFIHITHNYVKPDAFVSNPQGHKLSNQHYWSVDGKLANGFRSYATFSFDGNKSTGGANSYMDTLITIVNSDSVALFYRPDTKSNWVWQKHVTKMIGSLRTGYIKLDTLKLGQYCFGNLGDTNIVSIQKLTKTNDIQIYPNPTIKTVNVLINDFDLLPLSLKINNSEGKLIDVVNITSEKQKINLKANTSGVYLLEFKNKNGVILTKKLILE
ncbi:MAG: T9SS type A sorting domain-containing protein [Bacteroidetes bacterium]|nr:T9SS type A sorting domain-containing protein [Bacteroidota bacterium]